MEQTNNKTLFILRHNDIIPRTSKIVNKTNEIANNAIEVGLILKEEDKLIINNNIATALQEIIATPLTSLK